MASDDEIEILHVTNSSIDTGIEQIGARTWSTTSSSAFFSLPSSSSQAALLARLHDNHKRCINDDLNNSKTFDENEDYQISARQRAKIAQMLIEKGVSPTTKINHGKTHSKRRKLGDFKIELCESENVEASKESDNTADICTICTDPLNDTSRAVTDQCLHFFCFECIKRWCDIRTSCPVCRKPVRKLIHDIQSAYEFKLLKLQPKDEPPITLALSDYFHDMNSPNAHANRLRAANMLSRIVSRIHSSYSARLAEMDQLHQHPGSSSNRGASSSSSSSQQSINSVSSDGSRSSSGSVETIDDQISTAVDEVDAVPNSIFNSSKSDSQAVQRQRRARIYRTNTWCIGPDFAALPAGRRRLEPLYYRIVPRHLDRLAPWLERELSALLVADASSRRAQVERAQELIRNVDIESDAVRFRERLISANILPATLPAENVEHFQHELRMFMASGLRTEVWESVVKYEGKVVGRPLQLQPATINDEARLGRSHLYHSSSVAHSQTTSSNSTKTNTAVPSEYSQNSVTSSSHRNLTSAVATTNSIELDTAERLESLRRRLVELNRAASSLERARDYSVLNTTTTTTGGSSSVTVDAAAAHAEESDDSLSTISSDDSDSDDNFETKNGNRSNDSDAGTSDNSLSDVSEDSRESDVVKPSSLSRKLSRVHVATVDFGVIDVVDSGLESGLESGSDKSGKSSVNSTRNQLVSDDSDSDIEIIQVISAPLHELKEITRMTPVNSGNSNSASSSSSTLSDVSPSHTIKIDADFEHSELYGGEGEDERRRRLRSTPWDVSYYDFDVESQYVYIAEPAVRDEKYERLCSRRNAELSKPSGFDALRKQREKLGHSSPETGADNPARDDVDDSSKSCHSKYRWTFEEECQMLAAGKINTRRPLRRGPPSSAGSSSQSSNDSVW